MSNANNLINATGGNASGGSGFIASIAGPFTAILIGSFFWPMLLPLAGTGQNYTKIVPMNWVLEVLWLLFLAIFIPYLIRKRRARRAAQETPDQP